MITFAQLSGVTPPEIPWAAISPELVLFGFGIIVLLLEVAGEQRLRSGFLVFGVLSAAGVLWGIQLGEPALPGLLILLAVSQFVLTWLWRDRPRVLSAILTALGFTLTIAAVAWQWATLSDGTVLATDSLLGDMVAADGVALFTRVIVCLSGLITVPMAFAYLEERRIHRGEFYPLLMFAAVGMNLLASAADLIMVFISIEILSLALYILSGFAKRDLNSQEAAFKYFLVGSFSSAILLYGVALSYGVAGTTNIAGVGEAMRLAGAEPLPLAAMALLLVGFAYKTAVVPFHMWTPDVYQGAPTPITGFMAAATKAAAFAAFVRVFVGAFGSMQWSWVPVFWVLAVITMFVGAILAVVQTDLKRLLGYSAIAHAGYVLIGLIAVNRSGVSGTLFYLLVYAITSVGSFGVLTLLERRQHKAVAIDDLRGLARRYPLPAGMLALFLLSLAGIPPTGGFAAKLAVFRAGLEAGQAVLVVAAVISSVIAAFFYIRVIVAMFMDDESDMLRTGPDLAVSTGMSTGLVVTAGIIMFLGVIPGVIVDLARQAAVFAG